MSLFTSLQRRFITRVVTCARTQPLHRSLCIIPSRNFRINYNTNTSTGFGDGPEIINFSEKTLQWIVNTTDSHLDEHADKYTFKKDDVQLLSYSPINGKTLISSTAQNTSTWFINNVLSRNLNIYVHSFTDSGKFEPLRNLFGVNAEPSERDGLMTLRDESKNLCIEHADTATLGTEWMNGHGFNECFDVIFDEVPLDTLIQSEYIQTTIYGHCLKKGGVIYVSAKRLSGDMAGRKLREQMSALYGNSHFEMIGERETAWHTQFLFLKVASCDAESERESHRKDHWGDGHLEYNQKKIWNRSKVTENAGRGMTEGMDRVYDSLLNDLHDGKVPPSQKEGSSINPSYLDGDETFEKF